MYFYAKHRDIYGDTIARFPNRHYRAEWIKLHGTPSFSEYHQMHDADTTETWEPVNRSEIEHMLKKAEQAPHSFWDEARLTKHLKDEDIIAEGEILQL